MSGRMELLGVFALVLVVWAIVRMLDDDPRRSLRRYEPSGHTFVPCGASGGYGVVTETTSSRAVSAGYGVVANTGPSPAVSEEAMVEAEVTTCGDDADGANASGHWWSGEDDSGRCHDSDSDSSGSWDFGDD